MLSEYAVFNAYADNGHLFIEIIKFYPQYWSYLILCLLREDYLYC